MTNTLTMTMNGPKTVSVLFYNPAAAGSSWSAYGTVAP
jgi:hypothetical protein